MAGPPSLTARTGSVAAARTLPQLEETAKEVQATGRACLVVPTDVTDSASVNAMVEKAIAEFGRIDILVNNAGGATAGYGVDLQFISDQDWRGGGGTHPNTASSSSPARGPPPPPR